MTGQRAEVVGRVVASVVRRDLERANRHGATAPMMRVRSLRADETMVAARELAGWTLRAPNPVTLKIATTSIWGGCPHDWFLREGEERAGFRNSCKDGLVLFDAEETRSDEQSLRNMHAVSDGTLLDDADEGADRTGRDIILEAAWDVFNDVPGRTLPSALRSVTEAIYEVLRGSRSKVSLRLWVAFLDRCCSELAARPDQAASGDDIRAIVASSLHELELFPDPVLFSEPNASVRKRLRTNAAHAAFRTTAGKEIDEDDLEKRIADVEFRDENGEPLAPDASDAWRNACREIVYPIGQRDYSRVPFAIWQQLFARDARAEGSGLGTRIQTHLQQRHASRVAEYEEMDVLTGLDESDRETAERFLKAEPAEPGVQTLVQICTAPLQKAVVRLVYPSAPTVSDPIVALLRAVYEIRSGASDDQQLDVVTFGIERHASEEGRLTRALFRFLYGQTLHDLARASADGGDSRLEIDPELVQGRVDFVAEWRDTYPEADPRDEEGERDLAAQWAELRLVVGTVPQNGGPRRFAWNPYADPGMPGLARIVAEAGDVSAFAATWDTLEDWCAHAADPDRSLGGELPTPETAGPVHDWHDLRREAFSDWLRGGLSASGLEEYVDRWHQLMVRMVDGHSPAGSREPTLDAFLDNDTLGLGSGRVVMLASHPLRLRWLARHLRHVGEDLERALDGRFVINEAVENFYFDRIGNLSPHKQPPVLSPDQGEVGYAVREYGGHEEFAPIEKAAAARNDWMAAVDDACIDEMAGVAHRFLDAYPHKADGLSVLFVSLDGDAGHVERLVKRIRQREYANVAITVHVIAPVLAHDRIARALEDLEESDPGGALMPGVRTVIHPEAQLDASPPVDLGGQIDLALVPNLFGKRTNLLTQTRRGTSAAGGFDPWRDPTTHDTAIDDGRPSENVSLALVPEREDPLLRAWSTLNVWRYTQMPVSSGEDGAVDYREAFDYFALQVRFSDSVELFMRLHQWAQWVVSLDPFIGREQVEALDTRPDVITVKPRVGKNGHYTLVVSSHAGKTFVVTRLRKRIEQDLQVASGAEAHQLAETLYECGRSFAPGVILRALGLGRTAQEIVGLLVARWSVEQYFPRPEGAAFEAWIPLDDQIHWFGGGQAPRADLLRVIGTREGERLKLAFHVLEAKFREREHVGLGDQQLDRTLDTLRRSFVPAPPTLGAAHREEAADSPFWRRELLEAVQQTASRSDSDQMFAGLVVCGGDTRHGGLPGALRDSIIEGAYDVEEFKGILCSIGSRDDVAYEDLEQRPEGHEWIRVGRPKLREALMAIGRGCRPVAQSVATRTQPPPEPVPVVPSEADTVPVTRTPPVVEPETESRQDPAPATAATERGIGERELMLRYERILNALDEFRVKVTQPEGERFREGPSFYETRVVPAPGVRAEVVLAQTDNLKLRLELSADARIRAFVDRGTVTFEIPKDIDERYFVKAQDLWATYTRPDKGLVVPIGEDARGGVIEVDFSSSDTPHMLIGGTTGSGKSYAMETVLAGLCQFYAPEELRLMLVDPKGTEFADFAETPHLEGEIGMFPEDAIELLDQQVEEMQRRYLVLREHRVRSLVELREKLPVDQCPPWHLLVLDEYADLSGDRADRTEIEARLRRLAQKARAAGIHVIVATQKPSAEILSTSIRSNLPVQLALRVKTASDSRIIMDESGAEALAGMGDAFLKTARGATRVQCAYVAR